MFQIFSLTTCFLVTACAAVDYSSEEYVNELNSQNLPWQAGKIFDDSFSYEHMVQMVGAERHHDFKPSIIESDDGDYDYAQIPETLDLRKIWKNCTVIGAVYDQGNCKSSWAIAPVTTFTDNVCISTNGAKNKALSFGHVLTCCHLCGRGCKGGWDDSAWHFFQKHGLVTGGGYDSNEGCHPYPIAPCDRSKPNSITGCSAASPVATPACHVKCSNPKYKTPFKKDLIKAKDLAGINPKAVWSAKRVLSTRGSLAAFFPVYTDLFYYKKGVYIKSASAKFVGYHVVKVIGYDKLNGVEYWLAVNSWGKKWGDEGLFKVAILKNGVNFEDKFIYGIY